MNVRNLVIAAVRGEVVAIERKTGRVRWRQALDPEGGAMTIAILGDRLVLVATASSLACLGYDGGSLLWVAPLAVRPRGATTLLVEDDAITVARRGLVQCFDRDGGLRWARRVETTGDVDVLAPALELS